MATSHTCVLVQLAAGGPRAVRRDVVAAGQDASTRRDALSGVMVGMVARVSPNEDGLTPRRLPGRSLIPKLVR